MQDINSKLIDFFENFVDEMAEIKINQTDAIPICRPSNRSRTP
jgi:hypothetical protein